MTALSVFGPETVIALLIIAAPFAVVAALAYGLYRLIAS